MSSSKRLPSKTHRAALTAALFFSAACTPSTPSPPLNALQTRGKQVYSTTCIACHNSDPRKVGPVGPDIWGSSRELIEARVLSVKYPPGYRPKRTTSMMAPLPQLKGDLDALAAYLNGPGP